MTVEHRLKQLDAAIRDPHLLSNQGIGNEIGFYIFDYDPKDELIVAEHLPKLQLSLVEQGVKVREFNLYRTMINILEAKNLLHKALKMEDSQGNGKLEKAIRPLLLPEEIIAHIKNLLQGDEDLFLITGVGASYPLLRSHTILNNLHSALDRKPLVMFFPGVYDGQELRLFNLFKDDNYYRAFSLVRN
ncbi:MAG TPA: DUF1788 domain-containing protein [Pseudanabaena sp.]|nr:DUF1788 domain-containing protein [Pseudanabaena sp.]